jgi:hypothetical protein
MEDSLCAGRSPPPLFYRTLWRSPLERPLATVSSVNTIANRLPGLAGDSLMGVHNFFAVRCSGNLICVNLVQWRRDVAFAGFQVNIQMDISAEKMIFGVAGVDPKRRDELIKAG